MESVVVQAGDNEQFFIHLGRTYELNQKWEQAIGALGARRQDRPEQRGSPPQGPLARGQLDHQPVGPGRLAPHLHREEQAPPQEAALAEAEELKRASQTPEERMLKEIEADPAHVGTYLSLAEHYKASNRLDEAEKILARGRKAVPDDDVLKTVHADIQLSRLRRAIDVWTKKVKDNPDDIEAPDKLAKIKDMLVQYELNEYRRRVELHPEDAQLHLHYGRLLAAAGKHDEAIAEFQQARSDPDRKVQALHQLGLSFEAKNLPKLAERNYPGSPEADRPGDTQADQRLELPAGPRRRDARATGRRPRSTTTRSPPRITRTWTWPSGFGT